MKKTYFLFVLFGALLYSPLAFSDTIVNIGIKSNMSRHVLSNCRFGSALALYTFKGRVNVTILGVGSLSLPVIAGLRQVPDKLPDTDLASKVEFNDTGVKDLFGENAKYSSANSGAYPAVLFKYWDSKDYRIGMTLFSTLPKGVNAAAIFNNGEVNFAYRMTAGQGQLECDIYDDAGKLLGLVDYVTDSGSGSYKTLAYGSTPQERSDNSQILNRFSLDARIVMNYGGSYPKKRILLTMSDSNAAQDAGANKDPDGTRNMGPAMPAAAAPARTVGAQHQSTVANRTDHYIFSNCTRHDTHGSWNDDSPRYDAVIKPGGYFTFAMKSKGHGIQGEIRCAIHYQPDDPENAPAIEMGRLLIEINNDGTAFAVFPFINDPAKAKQLVDSGFQYKLYVENKDASNNYDNYSITVRE